MLDKILTINNNRYLVTQMIIYNTIEYYLLVNLKNIKDFKYCYFIDKKFYEVIDKADIIKLAIEFSKNN